MRVSKRFLFVNFITLLRVIGSILLIPIFFNYGYFVLGVAVLIFVSTDCIDGFLARALHTSTFFGAIFDALSDKLFNVIVLLLLSVKYPFMLLLIVMEGLILYIGFNSTIRGNKSRTTKLGKAKMIIMSVSIVLMMLLSEPDKLFALINYSFDANKVITYLICVIFIFESVTLLDYIRLYFKNGKKKKVFERELKDKKEIQRILLSHEFYKNNKNEPIEKLVLKSSK
jgi:phosphatidylglycerophosphate synthase